MVISARHEPAPTRVGEVHALVLAAGAGTRMGGGKLRRPWRGRPLLAWAAQAALAAPVARVWLVTGEDAGLATLLPADGRLGAIPAPAWRQGLSASLKAGIAGLPQAAGAALVFLGDMPHIPRGAAETLISAWRDGADACAPVCGAQRGHPVLLDRRLFAAVAGLEGDRGAGALLAGLGEGLALLPVEDEGVLFDIDTPEALET